MSKLIIGLGNPGKKYENTPHNLGREVVESLAEKLNFPKFQEKKKIFSAISSKIIQEEQVILAQPLCFMNESGKSANALFKFFKVKEEDIWVVHDDLDIDWGKIKISKNRGAAGHHGVESVIQSLGTKNFWRFRIGIRPEKLLLPPEIYVLKKINKSKQKEKQEIIEKSTEIIVSALKKIRKPQLSSWGF